MNDYLKEARLNSKIKYLKETFDYITDIGKPKKFRSSSNFPPIDKIEFLIQKGERCFNFQAPSINLVSNMVQYQNDNYGFTKPFSIQNDEIHWTNPNGVANLSMTINDNNVHSDEIYNSLAWIGLMGEGEVDSTTGLPQVPSVGWNKLPQDQRLQILSTYKNFIKTNVSCQ